MVYSKRGINEAHGIDEKSEYISISRFMVAYRFFIRADPVLAAQKVVAESTDKEDTATLPPPSTILRHQMDQQRIKKGDQGRRCQTSKSGSLLVSN